MVHDDHESDDIFQWLEKCAEELLEGTLEPNAESNGDQNGGISGQESKFGNAGHGSTLLPEVMAKVDGNTDSVLLTPPPSVSSLDSVSPSPILSPSPAAPMVPMSPDHMYFKQPNDEMINFDVHQTDDPEEDMAMIEEPLDLNDFVDENIVNLFPELM